MRRTGWIAIAAGAVAIAGAARADVFSYTGQVETWVVPLTGVYQVTFNGAAGGNLDQILFPGERGWGAMIGGDIRLDGGTQLTVVVGGQGAPGGGDRGGGGGGGSWLIDGSRLIGVAGGGGGDTFQGIPGGDGKIDSLVAGGVLGQGSSGAGWLSDGPGETPRPTNIQPYASLPYGTGGKSRPSFAGGDTIAILSQDFGGGTFVFHTGGFGGGGGADYSFGGGGGGYTGGAMRGGGGSYLDSAFTDIFGQSGANSGAGLIEINLISAAPEPETWLLMIAGLGLTGAALRRHRSRAPSAALAPPG